MRALSGLRYARITLFYFLMKPFSTQMRRKRMMEFCKVMEIRPGLTVLDLGGQPVIWDGVAEKLNITILNLPGIAHTAYPSHHNIEYVEGDACNIEGLDAKHFDIVFSNSVIEHVGDAGYRSDFAREVRRLGSAYWIQTPSKFFPIEAHNGMPFWWFYPPGLRRFFIERWRKKLPDWTQMVEGTDVVSKAELQGLFPEAKMQVERLFGLPKSYIAVWKSN